MNIWEVLEAEKERELARWKAEEAAKTPAQKEAERVAAEARNEDEHRKGVRLGWWTEDGEPIETPDDDEEEDEE